MASDDGSAISENSLRATVLIAAKPPEGKFSTSLQLLKLSNKNGGSGENRLERCVGLRPEQRAGLIKQSGLPPFLAHLLHPYAEPARREGRLGPQ